MANRQDRIEKLMSLTPSEFAASAARLANRDIAPGESVSEALGTGRVEISCAPSASVRLGGLLELPRAVVTISFHDVSDDDREAFMRRFELAFQRGGG